MAKQTQPDKNGPTGTGPVRGKRYILWLLAVPVVLFLLTPVVANRIHPVVLGMPFIIFYTLAVTVLATVCTGIVASLDPVYRAAADEPVPVDIAFGHADVSAKSGAQTDAAASRGARDE